MTINKELMDDIMKDGKIVWEDHTKSIEGIVVDCYKVEAYGVIYTLTKNDGEWVFINVESIK
jgi:hypothetical protein